MLLLLDEEVEVEGGETGIEFELVSVFENLGRRRRAVRGRFFVVGFGMSPFSSYSSLDSSRDIRKKELYLKNEACLGAKRWNVGQQRRFRVESDTNNTLSENNFKQKKIENKQSRK